MGMYQTILITAYIKVEKYPEVEKTTTSNLKSCSNSDCQNHDKETSGIFCSLCGSKIEMREVTNTIIKEVNPWSLNEEFGDEDMFYPCNGNNKILLPNRKRKHYISVDRDTREGNYQVPDSNDAIRELYQNHNDYLEFLTNKGIKWSVDFGLINYWS